MSDYKDTLNLPSTDFPMKANLAQREPEMLKHWQDMDLYGQICRNNQGKPRFILHDGLPYANGDLHLGHAINKTLKDFIIKSRQMAGFDAPYIPGWDCHGLPIEHNVEKKLGKAGDKVSHADFRKACREYAARQVENQKKDFIRLGVFGDWDKPYLTMDFKTEANIVRALGKIAANGHLVKGFKPVYWSVVGASALAEAEVEYREKTSFAIDVRFAAAAPDALAGIFAVDVTLPISVVIWTTTPWTLPANQAVCLNADLEYALVQVNLGSGQDECLVLSADMVGQVMTRYGAHAYEVLATTRGSALEGQQLQHPFAGRQVPIILGAHVTTEAGTGAVHTAPDHGLDDFYVGQAYGIGTLNLVDDHGVFSPAAGQFAGQHVYKVDESVIEVLQTSGALVAQEKIQHSYAHCWRTKTPLIYRATPQWFISMTEKDLLGQALAAVKQVKWIPDWGQARIELMLKGSPDWCVSRQRTWGVPITLFVHKQTQQLHPRTPELVEQVALRMETRGIEAWFELDPAELLGPEADQYAKVSDTLDVWFDSGVTHFTVMGQRAELGDPADLYLEGSDQHRGWLQSSLKTAVAMNGSAPYRQVLTHGFFVDAEGRKMSKSLGNTVAPQKIYQEYGADILRLWVAATDYRGEMTVSDEIFRRVAVSYRRIRNTARFMLSNLNGFDPQAHQVALDQMVSLDRWIVGRARKLQTEVVAHYKDYQFLSIYQKIHNFCVVELGSFYLDVIKDRQYACKADSVARRSTQTAMFHIVEILSKLIAPILSFTADESWQHIPGKRAASVFLTHFDAGDVLPGDTGPVTDAEWARLMLIKTAVNKELEARRAAKQIGSGLSAEVALYCERETADLLGKLGDELRFVLIVSRVEVLPLEAADPQAVAGDVPGLKVRVSASGLGKCERCWHHSADVGSLSAHPTLCGRCVENIEGHGEQRRFA